jgi:hypothetical protein
MHQENHCGPFAVPKVKRYDLSVGMTFWTARATMPRKLPAVDASTTKATVVPNCQNIAVLDIVG